MYKNCNKTKNIISACILGLFSEQAFFSLGKVLSPLNFNYKKGLDAEPMQTYLSFSGLLAFVLQIAMVSEDVMARIHIPQNLGFHMGFFDDDSIPVVNCYGKPIDKSFLPYLDPEDFSL